MRFPRDEWPKALTYYRPISKAIEAPEGGLQQKQDNNDEEKENESHELIKT